MNGRAKTTAASRRRDRAALALRCPRCGVKAGQSCVSLKHEGRVKQFPHTQRRRAAEAVAS